MPIVEQTLHRAELKPGMYSATITAVDELFDVETQYGIKNMLVVSFDVRRGVEVITLKKRYNRSVHKTSSFAKLVKETTGVTPGQSYDTDKLIGVKCQVLVAVNDDEQGGSWFNVTNVISDTPPDELEDEVPKQGGKK